ncbi:(d)CMP kinase [Candidatus Gottesmanbacteria bacterium]|nr:(d)CMP kinase [Candidatus Gottesmanbacteria bacterium]
MNKHIQIAIDGPVAAGKGDIALRLAKELGLVYIYTGAMYRALGLACMSQSVPMDDQKKVLEVLQSIKIGLQYSPLHEKPYQVFLDGEDVTDRIIKQDAAMAASRVAAHADVRHEMVEQQKQIAQGKSVVMEGRDIALRILPEADLKIYLTASIEERAKRRLEQFQKNGIEKTLSDVLSDTKKRDEQDMGRAADPLKKLPDSWELDTTNLNQEQVVDAIKSELSKRGLL